MSKLFIVPTPIGNLEDITLRAIRTLKESDVILAEDTRITGRLLKQYEIDSKMEVHHKFNEHKTVENLALRIANGEQIALVSDAGTPGISDPGFLLVKACVKQGLEIECLPGPSAVLPALVTSGLPNDRFYFEGFLPHKKGRKVRLEKLATLDQTLVLFESPFRVVKTLEHLSDYLGGDRMCSISREISKIHEETVRGTLDEVKMHFQTQIVKGEFVIVIEGLKE